jgi:hypothetical protein
MRLDAVCINYTQQVPKLVQGPPVEIVGETQSQNINDGHCSFWKDKGALADA